MRRSDLFEIILLGAIWGASFPLTRLCGDHFNIATLIAIRSAIAAVLLLGLLAFQGTWASLILHWRSTAFLGVINTAIPFCLLAYTTTRVSAGYAAIINTTAPIFGAVVSYFWFKERLTLDRIFGLFLGVIGVLYLSWGNVSFQPGGAGLGTLTGLLATLLYGISANFTRQRLSRVDALSITAGSQVSAAAVLAPWALLHGTEVRLTATDWLIAITLALVCSASAYLIYFRLIRNIGPARAMTCTFLIPVFGILWGALFVHEIPTHQTIFGGLIVLTGTVLSTGVLRMLAIPAKLREFQPPRG